jgi:uncharacterized protein GlcG (DUF336 family)
VTSFLEQAQRAVARGLEFARAEGVPMAIVVIDEHASVAAAARMDGTRPSTYDVTLAKANTALQLRAPTARLKEAIAAENQIALSQLLDRIVFIGGGLPIEQAGRFAGAIGAGGASEERDAECARACLEAFHG